jgi:hypothetical membrane protein
MDLGGYLPLFLRPSASARRVLLGRPLPHAITAAPPPSVTHKPRRRGAPVVTDSRTRLAGTASVASLALAVLLGLAFDPTVRILLVRARLSDLGRPGGAGAFPFDYGLVLAGLLGLVVVQAWWVAASDRPSRVTTALAGVAFAGLGLAGLFPAPSVAHHPALAAAYLAGWTAPLLDGVGLRRADAGDGGRSRAGLLLVGGAVFVAVLWAVRALVATTFVLSGPTSALLLAELATLALFAGWVLFRAGVGDTAVAGTATDGGGVSAGGR